jgi:DNA-binding MarR family transcriptional regulator
VGRRGPSPIDLSEIKAVGQGELAERLHLEKSTISRLVRQLIARGWVGRAPLPNDGRVMMVRLENRFFLEGFWFRRDSNLCRGRCLAR